MFVNPSFKMATSFTNVARTIVNLYARKDLWYVEMWDFDYQYLKWIYQGKWWNG